MKLKILLWIFVFLTLLASVTAHNYDAWDLFNRSDGSLSGDTDLLGNSYVLPRSTTTNYASIVSEEVEHDSNDYGYAVALNNANTWSFSVCVKEHDNYQILATNDNTETEGTHGTVYCFLDNVANTYACFRQDDGVLWTTITGVTGHNYYLLKHTVYETNETENFFVYGMSDCDDTTPTHIGNKTSEFRRNKVSNYVGVYGDTADGYSDNFKVWNGTIFDEDGNVSAPAGDNFSVTLKNIEGVSINNFTAVVNGSSFTTTDGTAETDIAQGSGTVDITIQEAIDDNGKYFNKTYASIDTSSNYVATGLYQAQVEFIGREAVTNNSIDGITIFDNGSTVPDFILADLYNFTFVNSSYFNTTTETNVPALFNGSISIEGIYSGIINIKVRNAYTNQNLTNFSGYIYSYNETYNQTFNVTDGNAELYVIPGSYLVYAEAEDYAIDSVLNYENITIDSTEENYTFSLYSNNSIMMYIYDEDTNLLITQNITITISGNASENVYYTTTGTYFAESLLDGNYTIKFQGGNYSLKSYAVTVAERSTQTLSAYLSAISEEVTFAFLDYDSGVNLEGVSMSMYRQINGSWTIVQTKTSDITGRALFQYVPGVQYKFFATYSGYQDKLFYLDPVLFSSYNVRLEKTTTITEAPGYNDISLIYYPKQYFINQTNNFTWIIASPSGSLETYNLSVFYPGGSNTYSGNNSIGEEFNFLFNITGALVFDYVNVSYCFDTTISTNKCYNYRHLIYGQGGNNTFIDLQNNTYGLDLFSRIMIATVIVLIVAGVLTMFGGSIIGAGAGIFMYGFLVTTGFIPLWAILPGALVGVVLIMRRSE